MMQRMRLTCMAMAGLALGAGQVLAAQGVGPTGATAKCRDGAYVRTRIQNEACRDHGGLEVWYGLAQNQAVAAAKRADIYALLEEQVAEEARNVVVRADLEGKIQERYTPDSADLAKYPSFMVYLDHVRQASGCRKMSNHCALCPGVRQIYCTTADAFLPLMAF